MRSIQDHMKIYFNASRETLLTELKHMVDEGVYHDRRRQITLGLDYAHYVEGSRIILELRDKFELTGDFTDLDVLLASVSGMRLKQVLGM